MAIVSSDTKQRIDLILNGKPRTGAAEPRLLLSDFLRHELGATGTHVGCEHGVCGACTIRLDGEAVRSCLMLAVQADGRTIETVEGLADSDGDLGVLQRCFREHHALQCGFCTPGILMSLAALLRNNPNADADEVRQVLSGHICRCTGYSAIIDAALDAAIRLRETSPPAAQEQ